MWIDFDGILNVRDLGGIPAAGGRRVKPGRLLRGAGLEHASDADVSRLAGALNLRHIADFRDASECARHPDRMIPGAQYHNLPALPALPPKTPDGEIPDFDAAFRRIYIELAESPEAAAAYREFFRILLDCREGAVYFHCTQGKDRTGVAALLALTALGAPTAAATEDYFLSNTGLKEAMETPETPGGSSWPREVKEKLFFVFQRTLDIYLDSMERNWNGLEGYIRRCLGVTEAEIRQLRTDYLE